MQRLDGIDSYDDEERLEETSIRVEDNLCLQNPEGVANATSRGATDQAGDQSHQAQPKKDEQRCHGNRQVACNSVINCALE